MSDDEPMNADEHVTGEGWVEISREEAFVRIERTLTQDLIAFEVAPEEEITVIGVVKTYTWFTVTGDDGDQREFLLAMRDPANPDAPVRWFIPSSFTLSSW